MISIWVALGIAWLASSVGFVIGAWWASLFRDDRIPEPDHPGELVRRAGSPKETP